MITLPSLISILRIIATPFIMLYISQDRWISAAFLFGCAALTDALDGALARYYRCSTPLGACLDAIGDKILLLGCFSSLYYYQPTSVPQWFIMLIMMKEISVILGSLYVGLSKGWHTIRPTLLGKATTLMQCIYCLWVFFCKLFSWAPLKSQQCLLGCIGVLMMVVIIDYTKQGLKV